MANKTYYGEYSLRHWINLILKKNIVLPDYQRFFVWSREKTEELINAFKEKQFIPPVTIGSFEIEKENINLIIDGQQRLTSILLVYLGLFPDKSAFAKRKVEGFLDENGNPIDEEDLDNILEWNFNMLIEKGKDKEQIKKNIIPGNYTDMEITLDDNFFDDTFLGFSYLVPEKVDGKQQQNFYSKVFRNINIQGESLLPQESRAALYYLDKDLALYFQPKFVNEITVNDARIDFVRYLSLLAQYKKCGSSESLAKNYSRKMEKYYEEYIYSSIGENTSNIFVKPANVFKERNYQETINKLENVLKDLELFKKFRSIIDIDVYLFGLIYFIVFEQKNISLTDENKNKLFADLDDKIEQFKQEDLHAKNPSAFKYLRARIAESIKIYKRYVNE